MLKAGWNILDKLKINKPTQIEPVKKSSPRTFADKETQAESIQYYDIENASETPGQGSPDWFQNDGQPSVWKFHIGTLWKMQSQNLHIMDSHNQ